MEVFLFINDLVAKILNSTSQGARFVFGPLVLAPGEVGDRGESSPRFILVFQVSPTIIFFSSLILMSIFSASVLPGR